MNDLNSSRILRERKEIDRLIDSYEDALWSGDQPSIEEFVGQVGQDINPRELLLELIPVDNEYRRKHDQSTDPEDYLQRFPEYATHIYALFADTTATNHNNPRTVSARHSKIAFSLPCRLGRFLLQELVGEGSYGKVYRAIDTDLDRTAAIKIPRDAWLTEQENHQRFNREARSAAALRHPGIVSVLEAGNDDGLQYLVSEFVEGTTLSEALAEQPFEFRVSARLIAAVADALQHAHNHGVIHRDLKPSNILLTASGTPKVTDFGLAKRLGCEETMTLEGQVIGTPAYMSPEQASGQVGRVDGRSDIYGLGAILYQLLTGELPFRGNEQMVIRQVIDQEPLQPRRLNGRVPRDLETICGKAMAKEPGYRYQQASDFAADLRRWLNHESIHAKPAGPTSKAWRWARRNPKTAASIVCTASLAIAVFMISLVASIALSRAAERERTSAIQARSAQQLEQAARTEAEAQRDLANAARLRAETERQTAQRVSNFLLHLFEPGDPASAGNHEQGFFLPLATDATATEVLDAAQKRIQGELRDQPDLRCRLLINLADLYRSRHELEKANYSLCVAAQRWSEPPPDTLDRARFLHVLGLIRHDQGELLLAETYMIGAVRIREKILGRQHLDTQESLFHYGSILSDAIAASDDAIWKCEPYSNCEQILREVVQVRREQLGNSDPDVAKAKTSLLKMLNDNRRDQQGKQIAIDAL